MPSATKIWTFNDGAAGQYAEWTKNPQTGLTYSGSNTSQADADTGGTGAGTGYVDCFYNPGAKNSSVSAAYMEWTGTWETLGVPAGNIVDSVQLTWAWKCLIYTTGAASTAGPFELRDSAGTTLILTLVAGAGYSGTTAWADAVGSTQNVPSTYQPSNTTIRLRGNATMAIGNSNSGQNGMLRDWYRLTINYSAPAVAGPQVSRPVLTNLYY